MRAPGSEGAQWNRAASQELRLGQRDPKPGLR